MAIDKISKPSILVVDDFPNNIDVIKSILHQDYRILAATSGELALKILSKQQVDLILLDVMMPKMDGYEVCRRLKSRQDTCDIPVIFVTALNDTENEEKGFETGAVDFISKPVVPAIVKARVRTHITLADQQSACARLVQQRTKELEESRFSAISMLGAAGHYNDSDTGVHIWRMADYAAALARVAQWTVEKVDLLRLAAPMHDMGKIGIDDRILKAPRLLTQEEMEIMKGHARIGHSILSQSESPVFQLAAEVALYHHEKWNGDGYPQNLCGEDIPQSARIVAMADVFDALTMERPYKKAWSVEEAFAMIKREAGEHFDPGLVDLFVGIENEVLEIKQRWDKEEARQKKKPKRFS